MTASQAFYNGFDDDTIVTPDYETKEECVVYLQSYAQCNSVTPVTQPYFYGKEVAKMYDAVMEYTLEFLLMAGVGFAIAVLALVSVVLHKFVK